MLTFVPRSSNPKIPFWVILQKELFPEIGGCIYVGIGTGAFTVNIDTDIYIRREIDAIFNVQATISPFEGDFRCQKFCMGPGNRNEFHTSFLVGKIKNGK